VKPEKRQRLTQAQSEVARLTAELEAAQRLAERLAKKVEYREPEIDGTVITWTQKFHSGSTVYTYAAVRARGLWHITGQATPLPWESLQKRWDSAESLTLPPGRVIERSRLRTDD
jgi:hypothetical protein